MTAKSATTAGKGMIWATWAVPTLTLVKPTTAMEFYKQALIIFRDYGNRRGESTVLGNLGLVCADLGETRRAIELYEQALKIDREIGDRRSEGIDLGNLGLAYADLGETLHAIELYEEALKIDDEIGYYRAKAAPA